jgi:hypothetical protein
MLPMKRCGFLIVSLTNRKPSSPLCGLQFVFYSSGVYFNKACGNTPDDLDHEVLAVGWGVESNQPYWLIKNSVCGLHFFFLLWCCLFTFFFSPVTQWSQNWCVISAGAANLFCSIR